MAKRALALVGATGLLLGAALLMPVAASAAPVTSPGTSSPPAAGTNFISMLRPVASRSASASGEAWVSFTGDSARFTLQVTGLVAGTPHLSHLAIGARGACTAAAPAEVAASLTTSGDTSANSALASTRYPTAADFTYSRTFTVDPGVVSAVRAGTAVLIVRGVVDGGTRADGPSLCGAFVASQMVTTPQGAADTGGGSASATSHPTLLTLGITALLAAVVAALVALRRRNAAQSVPVVVSNGFRRTI